MYLLTFSHALYKLVISSLILSPIFTFYTRWIVMNVDAYKCIFFWNLQSGLNFPFQVYMLESIQNSNLRSCIWINNYKFEQRLKISQWALRNYLFELWVNLLVSKIMTFLGLISKFVWEIGRKVNIHSIYGQSKGSLISETFPCCLQSPKKCDKNYLYSWASSL